MTKKMVYNRDFESHGLVKGLGITEMFHRSMLELQAILDGEIASLKQLSLSKDIEVQSIADLPPRTPQEEKDLAWDEELMR